jgi:dihydroorotase
VQVTLLSLLAISYAKLQDRTAVFQQLEGKLGALRLIEALSTSPARISGIEGGRLGPGARGDVVVLDPDLRWTVGRDTLQSKSLNSPWLGHELTGACMTTFVAGKAVWER